MAKRRKKRLVVVRVKPHGRGRGWAVTVDEAPPGYYFRKADAVRAARRKAKAFVGGASLRIHDRFGTFQEERTYPRSRDPRRSKG